MNKRNGAVIFDGDADFWVNTQTGELIEAAAQRGPFPDTDFIFVQPERFARIVSGLGKGQYEFVLYLLTHRSRDGYVYGRQTDFIEQSGLSANTVVTALRHLEDLSFIHKVNERRWMLNPKVVLSTRMSRQTQLFAVFCRGAVKTKAAEVERNRDKNADSRYFKVFPDRFKSRTTGLGKQQIRFLLHLLCAVDENAHVYGSREELAKDAGVSRETARATLKVLRERDFLRRVNNGCLMLNPDIAANDRKHNRVWLTEAYYAL